MAISLINFLAQTDTPMKKGLVDRVTNESEFLKRLKFIPVDGLEYRYNRREALGGIAFRGLNQNYSTPPSVINPQIESMAIMGGEVQTDRVLYTKQGDVARANEIGAKTKNAGLFFDRYVIKGDPAVNPLAFYGLYARVTGGQLFTAGTNGAALTLAMLDQIIDAVVGGTKDKVLVMNKYFRRQVTSLLRVAAHIISASDTSQQVTAYNDVPIVVLDEDGDQQPIMAQNETVGSNNATGSILCMRLGGDTDGEYVQGLVGSKMVEHVDVGLLGTYYLDIVEMHAGLAVFHPRAVARLQGLT